MRTFAKILEFRIMKYALVTGASRGIGKAIALRLAAAGWPVVINFLSNREAAQSVADEIAANGGTAELLPFDTSDPKAIEAALTEWEQKHPEDWFGVLVNNAGIRRDNVMFMMPDEDWHKVLDTTLNGYFYVTRHLLKHMMPRKRGGRIINTCPDRRTTALRRLPSSALRRRWHRRWHHVTSPSTPSLPASSRPI